MAATDQEHGWRSVVGRFVFVGVKTLGSALFGLVLYYATSNDLFLFGTLISICLSVPYDPTLRSRWSPMASVSAFSTRNHQPRYWQRRGPSLNSSHANCI
jgi:hypothetical protein